MPSEPFSPLTAARDSPNRGLPLLECRIEKPLSNPIFNYRNKLAHPSDTQRDGAPSTAFASSLRIACAIAKAAIGASSAGEGLLRKRPLPQQAIQITRIQIPCDERRVLQNRPEQRQIRFNPADVILTQRPQHPRNRMLPRVVPHDQLRQHRIVIERHIPTRGTRPNPPAPQDPAGSANCSMRPGEGKKLFAGSSA